MNPYMIFWLTLSYLNGPFICYVALNLVIFDLSFQNEQVDTPCESIRLAWAKPI